MSERAVAVSRQNVDLEQQETDKPDELTGTSGRLELPPAPYDGNDQLNIVFAGATKTAEEQYVRAAAEKKVNQADENSGRFKKVVRGIARGFLREAIDLGHRSKARDEMRETGQFAGMTDEEWRDLEATEIQRVLDDRGVGEMMDGQRGERAGALEGESGAAVKSVINKLLADYVSGQYADTDALRTEARRQLMELGEDNEQIRELIGDGEVYMSNIATVAEAVKGQVAHGRGIEDVLGAVTVTGARLDSGPRTKIQSSGFSGIVDKVADKGPNGPMLATAMAVGYGFTAAALKGAARRATAFGFVSAGALGINYLTERSRFRQDRAQIGREVELGESALANSTKRREKLLELLNDTRTAGSLTEAMTSRVNPETNKYEINSRADFDALLSAAANATARRNLSNSMDRGYIASSSGEHRKDYTAMLRETARSRAALRRYYESNPEVATNDVEFDEFYKSMTSGIEQELLTGTEEKDKEFNKYSRRESVKKAAILTGTGMVAAFVGHEAYAQFSDKLQGSIEYVAGKGKEALERTPLAAALHNTFGEKGLGLLNNTNNPPSLKPHEWPGSKGELRVDDKLGLEFGADGKGSITGPNGARIDGLERGPSGKLTQESIDKLHAAGLDYKDNIAHTANHEVINKQETVDEYTKEHGTRISKRSWYDNDTKAFDKNELRLDVGSQIDGVNGEHVFSVERMVESGSYHQGKYADLENLKVAVSITKGSQTYPILLDIGPDGRAVVPPDSPYASLMFDENNKFIAQYAEVVNVTGQDEKGLHIQSLATEVGPGYKGNMVNSSTTVIKDSFIHNEEISIRPEELNSDKPMAPFWHIPTAYNSALRNRRESGEAVGGADTPPGTDVEPTQQATRPETSPIPPYQLELEDRDAVERRRAEEDRPQAESSSEDTVSSIDDARRRRAERNEREGAERRENNDAEKPTHNELQNTDTFMKATANWQYARKAYRDMERSIKRMVERGEEPTPQAKQRLQRAKEEELRAKEILARVVSGDDKRANEEVYRKRREAQASQKQRAA